MEQITKTEKTTAKQNEIPVLTPTDYQKYFDDEGLRSNLPISDYFDPERPAPTFCTDVAKILYQLGVGIINSGSAYLCDIYSHGGQPVVVDDNRKRRLMAFYNKLLAMHGQMLPTASKALHYVFIVKLALDHLPTKIIENLYHAFKYTPVVKQADLQFPNGSSFLNERAIHVIIAAYILSNPLKFSDLLAKNYIKEGNLPFYLLAEREPSRVMALSKLDMRIELEKMPVMGVVGNTFAVVRPCYFFARQHNEQNLFSIEEEKKEIISYLTSYTAANKLSYMTRTNIARATKLINDIQNSASLATIDQLLKEQELFVNEKSTSSSWGIFSWMQTTPEKSELTPEQKEHSGFYRAITAARAYFNEITGVASVQPAAAQSIGM